MSETSSRRLALGLMSGTSRDGIDAAFLETDGQTFVQAGPWESYTYPEAFRHRLADAIAGAGDLDAVALELTDRHAAAVDALLAKGTPIDLHALETDRTAATGIDHQPVTLWRTSPQTVLMLVGRSFAQDTLEFLQEMALEYGYRNG